MGKFNIEMTKDEMIRYYANKIVEDGIKSCTEYSNIINVSDYGDYAMKYKNKILEQMYRDERLADIVLDQEDNFDMVFYTDYCPYYYEDDLTLSEEENIDRGLKKYLLKEFSRYYVKKYFNQFVKVKDLLNSFVKEQTNKIEQRDIIKNMLKKIIIESGFLEKYAEGIDTYIAPYNYVEFEEIFENYYQNLEQEELE